MHRENMQSLMKNLEITAKKKMIALDGTAHSYAHVDRVFRTATFLAKQEKADVELVQVGAILHDIGRALGQPHNETGARLAEEMLRQIAYPQDRAKKVAKIILYHPLEFRDKLETLEEKIVWDADKIDLLGAMGIARAFHWGGRRDFDTVVEYCFEEGLRIYERLNTQTAKRIAAKRHVRTKTFLSALKEEASLKDLRIK